MVRAVFQAMGQGGVGGLVQVAPEGVNERGGCRGARQLATGVHKHLGDLAAEVDLAVGCDGLELHQLQVLWSQLQLDDDDEED